MLCTEFSEALNNFCWINNPLLAGTGSIITQAISFASFFKQADTASKSSSGSTMVSFAKQSGIPAEELSPNVTRPEPALTNKEST